LVLARMAGPAVERTHLMEYGVVAVFIYEALMERASQGRRVPKPALLAIAATSLLGVLDECIQALLPSRVFDPIDILFNFLAGLMSVLASVALRWARRRGWRRGQAR
jgi:VanZ family protein